MIPKQLSFTLRRLGRNKLTTSINILGLTLGILSCLVIYLYVSFELSFDNFQPEKSRIYRLTTIIHKPDGSRNEMAALPDILGADLPGETTGFSAITNLQVDDAKVAVPEPGKPDRVFPQGTDGFHPHMAYVDPQYFDIFKYQWLAGNPAKALSQPYSIVLTESAAQRYFQQGGPTDWMGRTLVYYDSLAVSVTGIVKDVPKNSDLAVFSDLLSFTTITQSFLKKEMHGYNGFTSVANVYVKLTPGASAAQVAKQFPAIFAKHIHFPDSKGSTFGLQPFADVHFNSGFRDEYIRHAHKPTLFALAGIALFLLIIASINFVNLSTAQAILRAREVGVRKVLGSSRGSLIRQFLAETGIIVAVAMILALLLANPVITALHDFLPDGVRLNLIATDTWVFVSITVLITCLLAGWYPARALSAFLPVIALRGQGTQQLNSRSWLRRGLIVFQFTVSLLFIIATMIVGRQIHFMLNTDLGFKKDAILNVDVPWDQPKAKRPLLVNEVARLAGVQRVSLGEGTPQAKGHGGTFLQLNGQDNTKIDAGTADIDPDFIPLYGMTIVAGRNFVASDTTPDNIRNKSFIINETAAKALGFARPQDAVGKIVTSGFGGPGPILGVIKDFHAKDLHQPITPFFYLPRVDGGPTLAIKLASANQSAAQTQSLIGNIETTFKRIYPGSTFSIRFFDDYLARLYQTEQRTAQIMNVAMLIAILISCMGLFGLAAFTANQRTREFGIRKVLGAGVPHLVSLLTREFVVLVLLSTLIAGPLAGWAMHRWLQDFAYRTTVPWWVYGLAGLAAVAIALLTVSFQAIRTATANPVDSLRSE